MNFKRSFGLCPQDDKKKYSVWQKMNRFFGLCPQNDVFWGFFAGAQDDGKGVLKMMWKE